MLVALLGATALSCVTDHGGSDSDPIPWGSWTFPDANSSSPLGGEGSGERLPDLSAPDAGLRDLLRYARRNNPGLAAAFERWRAAIEVSPQRSSLPEPAVRFTGYLEEVETRIGPTQGKLAVSQAFPWFGTLAAAGRKADRKAAAALERLEAERWNLDARVRQAWYEMAWLEEAIAVAEGHRELLIHWESVARARMAVGSGSHADVLRAQVELGKIEDSVQTLVDLRRPLAAAVNAALGRPTDAPLPSPEYPLPVPAEFDDRQLLDALQTTSPSLLAMAEQVKAAQEGVVLAEKSFYPDFSVGVDYTLIGSAVNPATPGSGDDALALTMGFTVPIRRASYRAGLRQANADVRSAREDVEESTNRTASLLERVLYRLRDSDRRVHLYGSTLIPKGEESLQSIDIAYESGDEDFDALIDAQRVLLEFQLQVVRAEADRAGALAEAERLTGIRLHEEN